MTDLYFPDGISSPSWPFAEEHEDTSLTSKFEDGSMQGRSKFTRSRRKWTLKWKNIPRDEYVELMDFIRNKAKFAANSFMWVNTDSIDDEYGEFSPDMEEIEVRCTSVGKWTNDYAHFWSGELELTEV